ncbi:MAG: hypothetical protein RLZZ502_74 [Pseudomonadota bacterium]
MSHTEFSGLQFLTTACLALTNHGRVMYANAAAETLLQRGLKQLVGFRPEDFFLKPERLLAAIDRAVDQQSSYSEQECELAVVHQGAVIPLVVSLTVSYLDSATACAMLELKQIDQQLKIAREERQREQAQANRELIRTMAHEIKNPLGGIRGAAQLLQSELKTEEEKEFTTVIIEEADRLQSLVDRLLTPHQKPKITEVNIHDVLRRVHKLVAAAHPQISLVCDFDVSLPSFQADSEQLMQAFLNITQNAAQILDGSKDGEVRLVSRIARQVTVLRKRHRLALDLRIIDNGPGIPPALLDKIFFPLVSARSGGTGLGLTIAQTYIAQHEGSIEVQSQPGRTEFQVLLPLAEK